MNALILALALASSAPAPSGHPADVLAREHVDLARTMVWNHVQPGSAMIRVRARLLEKGTPSHPKPVVLFCGEVREPGSWTQGFVVVPQLGKFMPLLRKGDYPEAQMPAMRITREAEHNDICAVRAPGREGLEDFTQAIQPQTINAPAR